MTEGQDTTVKRIPLRNRKKEIIAYALVDAEDFDWLNAQKWYRVPKGYAVGSVSHAERVYMHRMITGASKGTEVDHINGDKLDNRRCNLRICTHAENGRNRKPDQTLNKVSAYKGVSRTSKTAKRCRWRAAINCGGKRTILGSFLTEEDAARAYDAAAVQLHGDFARLNFPIRESS